MTEIENKDVVVEPSEEKKRNADGGRFIIQAYTTPDGSFDASKTLYHAVRRVHDMLRPKRAHTINLD